MRFRVTVDVEAFWRGSILDAVANVTQADLLPLAAMPTHYRVDATFTLTDGNQATVGCGRSPDGRFGLSVTVDNQSLLSIEARSPFRAESVMPDGKLYLFRIVDIDELEREREYALRQFKTMQR